jgi:ankyrin repeat protein
MRSTNLRLLQLNIMKSRAGMEALINDHQTQNLDVLLIQEPPVTAYRTHVNHSAWRLYRPTHADESARFRSLLYINRRISTSSLQAASSRGNTNVVQMLLYARADVNAQGGRFGNPLQAAAYRGSSEVVWMFSRCQSRC